MIRGQAVDGFPFTIRNTATGEYLVAGAITGYVTLDDGAQTVLTNTPVYKGNGQWTVDLTAEETDGATIGLIFTHLSGSQAFTIFTQSAEEAASRVTQHETDLLNDALGQIGEAPITAIDDGSVNANWCLTFYPALRDNLLREHHWRFATARVALVRESAAPAFGWSYAYALPTDFLKLQTYVGSGTVTTWSDLTSTEPLGVTFKLEGGKLLTDDTTASIIYTRRVTNPSQWDAIFYQVLSTWLASKLAGAILKGTEGRRVASDLLAEAVNVLLPTAKATDSQEASFQALAVDDLTWGR